MVHSGYVSTEIIIHEPSKYVSIEYSLVGKYTGTVIDFSDYLSFHSNENTNYNYDYFFVSEIEHENIPMDCYTLIIKTVIV